MDNAGGLSPELVETSKFAVVRRGYEPERVRLRLQEAAAEIRRLNGVVADLSERLARFEAAPSDELDAARVAEALGDEAARLLQSARGAAQERIARAEAEGAEMTERARAAAAAIVDEGRDRGRAVVQEAGRVRERILADLAQRRKTHRVEVEQLRAVRDRLLESLTICRQGLDEWIGELVSVVPQAKAAAERAGLLAAAEPAPTVSEIEAEIETGRMIGLRLEDEEPDAPEPELEEDALNEQWAEAGDRRDVQASPVAPVAADEDGALPPGAGAESAHPDDEPGQSEPAPPQAAPSPPAALYDIEAESDDAMEDHDGGPGAPGSGGGGYRAGGHRAGGPPGAGGPDAAGPGTAGPGAGGSGAGGSGAAGSGAAGPGVGGPDAAGSGSGGYRAGGPSGAGRSGAVRSGAAGPGVGPSGGGGSGAAGPGAAGSGGGEYRAGGPSGTGGSGAAGSGVGRSGAAGSGAVGPEGVRPGAAGSGGGLFGAAADEGLAGPADPADLVGEDAAESAEGVEDGPEPAAGAAIDEDAGSSAAGPPASNVDAIFARLRAVGRRTGAASAGPGGSNASGAGLSAPEGPPPRAAPEPAENPVPAAAGSPESAGEGAGAGDARRRPRRQGVGKQEPTEPAAPAPAPAPAPGDGTGAGTGAGAGARDIVEAARAVAVGEIERGLKRMVLNEQGELLDALRRMGPRAIDMLTAADPSDYARSVRGPMEDFASYIDVSIDDIDLVAAGRAVVAVLVEPVRGRLREIASEGGDFDHLNKAVRALYRESRSRRVEAAASEAFRKGWSEPLA